MSSITSTVGVWVAPMAVLVHRITQAHMPTKPLGIMRSFKKIVGAKTTQEQSLLRRSLVETITTDMLPRISFSGHAVEETLPKHRGSLMAGVDPSKLVREISATHTIRFLVQSDVKDGLVNLAGLNNGRPGHYDLISRVLQVIECDTDGQPDSSLDGSCLEPIACTVAETETDSELFYESVITVVCRGKGFYPHQRTTPIFAPD